MLLIGLPDKSISCRRALSKVGHGIVTLLAMMTTETSPLLRRLGGPPTFSAIRPLI